jgi:hypothetical protein
MLSTLPKLADKTFIVGFFLPALLFAAAGLVMFSDFPFVREFFKAALGMEATWRFVFLLLGLWSLSVLMSLINHYQYQVLEGYRWPIRNFNILRRRERNRFDTWYEPYQKLSDDWAAARREKNTYPTDLQRKHDELRKLLVRDFPEDQNFLLPTRFGNAIRAFETYSQRVYGADAIPLWLHLSSVIPKEFRAALDDARAEVNFLVNICYFAGLISLVALFRVLAHGAIVGLPFLDLKTLAFISIAIGATCICRMSYNFSIQRIYAWGDLVKAAFDCFLPALAERLGYELPESTAEQRAFWVDVSRRAIFHFPLRQKWLQIQGEAPSG